MTIYKCDRCNIEIPANQVVSIMKLWRASNYSFSPAGDRSVGKMSKVEGVEKDEKILCPKCADEIWGQIKIKK